MIPYKEKSFLHLQKRNSYLQSRENLPRSARNLHFAQDKLRKESRPENVATALFSVPWAFRYGTNPRSIKKPIDRGYPLRPKAFFRA